MRMPLAVWLTRTDLPSKHGCATAKSVRHPGFAPAARGGHQHVGDTLAVLPLFQRPEDRLVENA